MQYLTQNTLSVKHGGAPSVGGAADNSSNKNSMSPKRNAGSNLMGLKENNTA